MTEPKKKYITFPASSSNCPGSNTVILRSSIVGFSEPDPYRIAWTDVLLDSGQSHPLNGIRIDRAQKILKEFDEDNS